MKRKLAIAFLVVAATSPSFAQAPKPKASAKMAETRDVCAPIGRTADGKLVYQLECNNMPAPPPPPPVAEAPPPRPGLFGGGSGIFGMSTP